MDESVTPQVFCTRRFALLALFLGVVSGCATTRAEGESEPEDPNPGIVIVSFAQRHQTIRGFGASSAWTAPTMSTGLADQFFSEESGIGLSLLRLQVKPSGETTELDTARLAVARGASLWAAPWSPPGQWKTNGSTTNGGELLPEHYDDWANSLADFAASMEQRDLPLLYLSAQNEPDYSADWDTCEWSPEQLATFIGDHLGPALEARGLSTKVLAPESANWNSFSRYADAILGHASAARYVDAVATHSYDGSAFAYEPVSSGDVELWETEVDDPGDVNDSQIASALRVATMIYDHLTVANASAWHFWWLVPRLDTDPDNSALTDKNLELTARAHAMGNFARFVRPGFVRVGTSGERPLGVRIAAFVNPDDERFAIVAINQRQHRTDVAFDLGMDSEDVTSWVTSEEFALQPEGVVDVLDGGLSAVLEGYSITTITGTLVE